MSSSKKAIKKLTSTHDKFELNVEAVSGGAQGNVTAKALITIFEHTEKGAVINKKSSAYGSGANLEEAQGKAIVNAVEGLGL